MLKPETIEELKKKASRTTWLERVGDNRIFVVDDFSGGNQDDAYEGGIADGETYMAREVLADLGIEWE